MNVSLSPELETLVNQKVKTGMYNSASEVIREGLRLLQEQDQLKELRREELRKEIMKGVDDMRQGRYTTFSNQGEIDRFVEKIKKEGRQELAKKRKQTK